MKKIIITPAGRKKYIEILYKYLKKFKDEFDQWHLWMNTQERADNEYLDELVKEDWIEQVYWDKERYPTYLKNRWNDIHYFYPIDSIDPEAIYLRIDDDIVWIEDKAITKMFDFRLKNPQYFLIIGNIINNALIGHLHQRFGVIDRSEGRNDYICFCNIGWKKPEYAELVHRTFLKNLNSLDKYKFSRWEMFFHNRISVNVACWLGKDFAKFNGRVGLVEEDELSTYLPIQQKQVNCINGQALFSHYSFYTQRDYLDKTDILQKYSSLI